MASRLHIVERQNRRMAIVDQSGTSWTWFSQPGKITYFFKCKFMLDRIRLVYFFSTLINGGVEVRIQEERDGGEANWNVSTQRTSDFVWQSILVPRFDKTNIWLIKLIKPNGNGGREDNRDPAQGRNRSEDGVMKIPLNGIKLTSQSTEGLHWLRPPTSSQFMRYEKIFN